jgi:hypothetical protein
MVAVDQSIDTIGRILRVDDWSEYTTVTSSPRSGAFAQLKSQRDFDLPAGVARRPGLQCLS